VETAMWVPDGQLEVFIHKAFVGSAHGQFCTTKNAIAFYLELTW